ncbi:hypothetical protein AVEN_45991-1 [Araneus ventricosus]|uniref:Uncharacterized protein n=1 Tax=Araneus ventricosus TaxID=182803 RepID=A0A4Y2F6N4_ARAVE|nr:hypothetical protein AVEN_45991-1 [Araneus ventricosus]
MPLRSSHSQIEEQIDTFIQNFKRNSAVFVSNFNLENYGATLRHTFSAGQLSPTDHRSSKRSSFLSTYSSSSRRTSVDGTNSSFSEGESFYHDDADISESSSGKYNFTIILLLPCFDLRLFDYTFSRLHSSLRKRINLILKSSRTTRTGCRSTA